MQYVVVAGTIKYGIILYGPFETEEDAAASARRCCAPFIEILGLCAPRNSAHISVKEQSKEEKKSDKCTVPVVPSLPASLTWSASLLETFRREWEKHNDQFSKPLPTAEQPFMPEPCREPCTIPAVFAEAGLVKVHNDYTGINKQPVPEQPEKEKPAPEAKQEKETKSVLPTKPQRMKVRVVAMSCPAHCNECAYCGKTATMMVTGNTDIASFPACANCVDIVAGIMFGSEIDVLYERVSKKDVTSTPKLQRRKVLHAAHCDNLPCAYCGTKEAYVFIADPAPEPACHNCITPAVIGGWVTLLQPSKLPT